MPQPPLYSRLFSFTDHEASTPTAIQPGVSLDGEFDNIATTLRAVLANLAKVQRDDGALANAIVGLDALSPAALLALGAGGSWLPRGVWATATDYGVGDVVSSGTATYVTPVAHHSAALLATDIAAGRWILLFDSGGSIPSDASVTAAKLADGSVTADKVGFTALDLTGSIRAQGGLAAGLAPAGALLHGKTAAGGAYSKIERVADDQGAVGFQMIGVGATWTLEQAASSNDAQLRKGATVLVTYGDKSTDTAATVRAVAGSFPTAGVGVGLSYVAGVGYVGAFDYDAVQWKDLKVRGKVVSIVASGVDVMVASSAGVDFPVPLSQSGVALGFRGIPQNQQNANYVLAPTDNGEDIYSENVGAQSITLPAFADVPLGTDFTTVIINDGTSPITITQGAGVTARLAGTATTGNRTVGAGGMAFVKCVKANRFFVSGPGVS